MGSVTCSHLLVRTIVANCIEYVQLAFSFSFISARLQEIVEVRTE
jgi:hypothetical protein